MAAAQRNRATGIGRCAGIAYLKNIARHHTQVRIATHTGGQVGTIAIGTAAYRILANARTTALNGKTDAAHTQRKACIWGNSDLIILAGLQAARKHIATIGGAGWPAHKTKTPRCVGVEAHAVRIARSRHSSKLVECGTGSCRCRCRVGVAAAAAGHTGKIVGYSKCLTIQFGLATHQQHRCQ